MGIWSTHITTPPPSNEAGSSKPRKSHRKKNPQKIPKIPTTIQKFLNITNYVCPLEKSKEKTKKNKTHGKYQWSSNWPGAKYDIFGLESGQSSYRFVPRSHFVTLEALDNFK